MHEVAQRRNHSRLAQEIRLVAVGFRALLEYTFKANGHDQTGKRVAYRVVATRDEKEAPAIAKKYPVGVNVKVTYDPANSQDSVWEPGPEGNKVLTSEVIWLFASAVLVFWSTCCSDCYLHRLSFAPGFLYGPAIRE